MEQPTTNWPHGLKKQSRPWLRTASLATGLALWAEAHAGVPLKATMEFSDGRAKAEVFLLKASTEGFLASPSATGQPSVLYPHTGLREVKFEEPAGWTEAVAAWRAGQWETAIPLLRKLAKDYGDIASYRGSPGAMAQFYLQECLRQSGQWDALAAEVTASSSRQIALDTASQTQWDLHRLWALAAARQWQPLMEKLSKDYETGPPGRPGASRAFKPAPTRIHAQLSYLRGSALQAQGRADEAQTDFYRAFSLEAGSDKDLKARSLEAAIAQAQTKSNPTPEDTKEIAALKKLLSMVKVKAVKTP